jgi:hypothetical protein
LIASLEDAVDLHEWPLATTAAKLLFNMSTFGALTALSPSQHARLHACLISAPSDDHEAHEFITVAAEFRK